ITRKNILNDRMQIGIGLCGCYSRLQPADYIDVADAFHHLAALKHDGKIDIRSPPHKSWRHHSDDCSNLIVQTQICAEHMRIAAEVPLPELIAKHGHRRGINTSVGGRDVPAKQWLHAHNLEGVGSYEIAAQALRIRGAGQ